MNMKKSMAAVLGLFFIAAIFLYYENHKAENEINSVRDYWLAAVDQARLQNLPTDEFYKKHSNVGDIVADGSMPGPTIVQSVELNGFVCPKYSIHIYYSSDGAGGSNLSFVSGRGHGFLCSI